MKFQTFLMLVIILLLVVILKTIFSIEKKMLLTVSTPRYDPQIYLDTSQRFVGVKSEALRYLFALKQGIFQSGSATIVIKGRVIDIGPKDSIAFRIHLRHVTDVFVNTITPDHYKDALVTLKKNNVATGEPISLLEIKPGDIIEVKFILDFVTAEETIVSIDVYRS